ncbi:MAG: carbohydrate kinase family protein, partial [Anaerolineaceae bacterium]
FGDINLDVSMPVPEIPPPGQDVYADKLSFNLGGSSTNTAIDLSQLGITSHLLGSIGTDLNGDRLLNEMKSYGLDTGYIFRKSESPSGQIFLAILPDGERSMYSFRGANVYTTPADIPDGWESKIDLLHLSGYVFLKSPQRDTALSLIETAHKKHIPISIDTGMDPVLVAHNEMEKVLKFLDICICGHREGTLLTGKEEPSQILHAFFDLGMSCGAIKLGNKGCLVGLNGKVFRLPALSIQAVDTTGSGDAFSAGLLTAWLNKYGLSDMCMLANSLGAYMATQLGSISSNLSWASLLDFLNQTRDNQSSELRQCISDLIPLITEKQ